MSKCNGFVGMRGALTHSAWACSAICLGLGYVTPMTAYGVLGDVTDPNPIAGTKQAFVDPADDMALRRTDDDSGVDPLTGNWPELSYVTLGRWAPTDAFSDPYFGDYSTNGGFCRLDIVLASLVPRPA